MATANVNGIRAAVKRGIGAWLAERQPDILCLQEVRAPDSVLREALGDGWYGVHEECSVKGRSGVAVMSRVPPLAVRAGFGDTSGAEEFVGCGRWVEADFAVAGEPGLLTVASVYVHKGEAGTAKQEEKYRFLDVVRERMNKLAADGRHLLVGGDFNIAHREIDLKNWKGNRDHAGFLPEERAWFDRLLHEDGFVDTQRSIVGEEAGPYTWWSWRGQAFDVNAGWRIDYVISGRSMADKIVAVRVDKAASYGERWSDHAPAITDVGLVYGV